MRCQPPGNPVQGQQWPTPSGDLLPATRCGHLPPLAALPATGRAVPQPGAAADPSTAKRFPAQQGQAPSPGSAWSCSDRSQSQTWRCRLPVIASRSPASPTGWLLQATRPEPPVAVARPSLAACLRRQPPPLPEFAGPPPRRPPKPWLPQNQAPARSFRGPAVVSSRRPVPPLDGPLRQAFRQLPQPAPASLEASQATPGRPGRELHAAPAPVQRSWRQRCRQHCSRRSGSAACAEKETSFRSGQ